MQTREPLAAGRGLDIGTSRIVLAEPNGVGFSYRAQLNAFVALPASKITEGMLQKESIPYKTAGRELVVLGDRAEKLAHIFCGDTRRPMQNGLLNPSEHKSLEVIEETILRLCNGREGGRIFFSVPSAAPGGEGDLAFHETTLQELLTRLGFQARSINEGLAVVFAELEANNFTGIGVSFGGGMCNVCLAYLGMPVISFSTSKAGDFIDRSAAAVTGEKPTAIRLLKEGGFGLNGHTSNNIEQALTIYYDDMIQTVVARLENSLAESRKVPKLEKPVPIVVAGGSAMLSGFLPRLEKAIRQANLPLAISEIRLAADPLNTTAKGALMAALLDS
ncbi:MAG TPA: hypothetical protein VEU62_12025 [Bryobacterales bacterium]|nr:hypothetical protein [Bryobacterales bacterium]